MEGHFEIFEAAKSDKETKITNAGEIVETGDEIDEENEEDDSSSENAPQSILDFLSP